MFIKHYLLAIQFFTRIPITGKLANWVGYSPEMLRAKCGAFCWGGLVVGAVAAGVYVGFDALIPSAFGPLMPLALPPWLPFCLRAVYMRMGWRIWPMAWADRMTAIVL